MVVMLIARWNILFLLRRNLDPQVIPGGDWGSNITVISVANRTIYLAKHSDLIKIGRICILVKGIF